jgi:hypothetical protein
MISDMKKIKDTCANSQNGARAYRIFKKICAKQRGRFQGRDLVSWHMIQTK